VRVFGTNIGINAGTNEILFGNRCLSAIGLGAIKNRDFVGCTAKVINKQVCVVVLGESGVAVTHHVLSKNS
jgi:hypothetical protein